MSQRRNVENLVKRNMYLKAKIWKDYYMMKGDLMRLEMENKLIEEELESERKKGAEIMVYYAEKLQRLNAIIEKFPIQYTETDTINRQQVRKRNRDYSFDQLNMETEMLDKETKEVFRHLNDPINVKRMFKDYSPDKYKHRSNHNRERKHSRHSHHSHTHSHEHRQRKKQDSNISNASYNSESYIYSQDYEYSVIEEEQSKPETNKPEQPQTTQNIENKSQDSPNDSPKPLVAELSDANEKEEIYHRLNDSDDISPVTNSSKINSSLKSVSSDNILSAIEQNNSKIETDDAKMDHRDSRKEKEESKDEVIKAENELKDVDIVKSENQSPDKSKVKKENESDSFESVPKKQSADRSGVSTPSSNKEASTDVKTPKTEESNSEGNDVFTPKQVTNGTVLTPKDSSHSSSQDNKSGSSHSQKGGKNSSDFNFTDSPPSVQSQESKASDHLVINGEIDPDFNPKAISEGDFVSNYYSQSDMKTPDQISTLPYISYSAINQTQSGFQTPPPLQKHTVQFGTPIPSNADVAQNQAQQKSFSEMKPNVSIITTNGFVPSPKTPTSSSEIPSFMKSSSPSESANTPTQQNGASPSVNSSEPSFMKSDSKPTTPENTTNSKNQAADKNQLKTPSGASTPTSNGSSTPASQVPSFMLSSTPDNQNQTVANESLGLGVSSLSHESLMAQNVSQEPYSFLTDIKPRAQSSSNFPIETHVPEPLEIPNYFAKIGADLFQKHDPTRIVMDTSSSSFISNDSILIE